MHGYARAQIFLVALCGLGACSSGKHGPPGVNPGEPPVVSAASASATAAVSTLPSAAASSVPPAGWEKVKLDDQVPLCVFSDHDQRGNVSELKDVHKQVLRANARVVFGTFASGCHNEACDTPPNHQCWVDSEEPSTLVVHSSLSFEHKPGSVCTTDCHPVIAGCETPVLKAGTYTVKYGARVFTLRVPSVVRAPCFKMQ